MSIADFPNLKTILLAGERVWKDLNDLWINAGKRVLHMYGPTECTVGCCFLDPDVKPHYTGLIGNPYASKFWIVDPQNSDRLQPIGAPGEILIEGPTVGRCYLGDPEKTKQIFISPPKWFSSICQRKPLRFYKTGDLGRLTKHGDYEVVGRKDSQVKIRGWRIEVLEIEHQIRLASGYGTAVEIRNPALVPGQEQLVAFIELQKTRDNEGTTADVHVLWDEFESGETQFSKMIEQLETKLREVLPSYMVPSAYIPIRTFPMTNIFKLNRRKLKETANALDISATRNTKSGPRGRQANQDLSEDEKKLLVIWTQVLHLPVDSIGTLDDFFAIGGDSLKAMAAVSAARRVGMSVSVAKLNQSRTVEALAQNIGEDRFDRAQDEPFSLLEGSIVPRIAAVATQQCQIATGLIEEIMPLTDMQNFYISSQVRQPRSWISTAAFELPPSADAEQVKRLWAQLMAHHPITRTRFVKSPFGLFQVILKSESVIWKSSSDVASLLKDLEGAIRGFGFPPHASGLLLDKEQKPSHLIWHANHGLLDQLMLEHLSEELGIMWKTGVVTLPDRPSFKRLIKHRNESNKEKSQEFWYSHLRGADFKPLFKDDQVTDSLADSKLSHETELTVPAWIKISEYAVAITGLALSLTKIAGNGEIPFMLVRSGRVGEMPGSEDVVGPLLTRTPLRISINRNGSIADLLRNIDHDFQESGKHEIAHLDDFLSASSEAAAHLQHALWLNFTPPTEGLTLGRDALFPVNSDFRDGMAESNQIISVFGEIFRGKLKMEVIWEKEAIPRSIIEKLLGGWKAFTQLLSTCESSLSVGKLLDTCN
jgi:aryl carrier-like protein